MQCPECHGLKIILVSQDHASSLAVGCPTCEGSGEIPDPPRLPDHCLTCGTPIPEGKKWCDFHRAADLFGV